MKTLARQATVIEQSWPLLLVFILAILPILSLAVAVAVVGWFGRRWWLLCFLFATVAVG